MPQGRNRIKATPFIFLQDKNADTNQELNAIKMSEQPTPETDAFIASQNHSPTTHQLRNFARIFERERDEARESLKHITEYGTEEINAAVDLRQKLAQALVDLDNMQDQRDLAMKVIKRLEQERDEAREALMKIEEVFIDSDDTYEDWRKMGNIARSVLEAAK